MCPKTGARTQHIHTAKRMGTTKLIFLTHCSCIGLPALVYLTVYDCVDVTERQSQRERKDVL